jgi:hypothetical protein
MSLQDASKDLLDRLRVFHVPINNPPTSRFSTPNGGTQQILTRTCLISIQFGPVLSQRKRKKKTPHPTSSPRS